MDWWNHLPEHIRPTIIEIGSFQIRYYGLMYAVGFVITYLLVLNRIKKEPFEYPKELIQNYFLWTLLAVMVGGRLGYVLFYNPAFYIKHPWRIISPFDFSDGFRYIGIFGMSYHGALLGIFLSTLIFCLKNKVKALRLGDLLAPAISLGYTFGRIGNFLNGELYGRVTSVPWGMYFPLDPTGQLRHPSQLYEAFLEGFLLFVILWSIRKIRIFDGFHVCLYLIGYGIARFAVEFLRQPDPELGQVWLFLTMGQMLSLGMIGGGGLIILICFRQSKAKSQSQ